MITSRASLPLLLALLVAGCGSTPSRVRFPDVKMDQVDQDRYVVAYQKDASGNFTIARSLAQVRSQRLPIEYTRSGILSQLEAHEHIWSAEAASLAHDKEDLGNLQFGGAVLGALGVVGKALDVGRAGAAVAGGAGVWDSRYKLEVQRNNYRQASEAAECARTRVESIQPAFFTAYYYQDSAKGGMLRFSKDFLSSAGGLDDEGFRRLSSVFRTINRSLVDMRRRLQAAQESVSLATPSSSEIVAAIQQKTAEQDVNTARAQGAAQSMVQAAGRGAPLGVGHQIMGLDDGQSLDALPIDDPIAQAAAAQINDATVKLALDLENDLATCVARLSK